VGYFKGNLMLHKSYRVSAALTLALLCNGWLAVPSAYAQKANAQTPVPAISGTTLDKKQFQLTSLKGKVVLVMFWSTDCAVCRDKMAELRQNVQGWADKPFELVLVSMDRRMEDVEGYNAIINKAVPMKQRFTQLWIGDKGYQDNLGATQLQRTQLPTTLLIDKSGKLLERYNGRIPAEVWDTVADLL
jgi:cytochrome oxidase Cu insertion factor (SCO1/SenC/PrrC family)